MSALGALAIGTASTIYNKINEDKYIEKQKRNQLDLMRQANNMQLQNDLMEPSIRAAGLKAAGVNPMVMAGNAFTPAAVSSGSVAKGDGRLADMSLASAMLDYDLKRAEIANVNEQTRGEKIINDRNVTADSDYNQAIIDRLNETRKLLSSYGIDASAIQDDIDRLEANPTNLGNFEANMKAVESTSKSLQSFTERIKSLLDAQVFTEQLDDGSILSSIAGMPKAEKGLITARTAAEIAQKFYLLQGTKESLQKVKNLQTEVKKMDAEVVNLSKQGKLTDAQTQQILNNDVGSLVINGEYGKALKVEGLHAVDAVAHGAGQGLGFGLAAAATRGAAVGGASSAAAPVAARGAVASSLARNGKEWNSGASPFKYGTPSHNVYKALETRFGEGKVKSMYVDFLKDKSRGRMSFSDWVYKYKTLPEMKLRSRGKLK